MAALKPQSGPQEIFLASNADIAIYGGAAGGGKSYALLLEPLRHIHNPKFRAVIFRRTSKQIRNEGGLWDTSRQLYAKVGGEAKETDLLWRFPSGATISFGYMEHEKNRYDWQGTEITYLGFDELTHFTEKQFFYLLSRNRSTSGVAPYVRATCNPDADSWVAPLVSWWINPKTGLAQGDRSGVLRWFFRDGDELNWHSKSDALTKLQTDQIPKSLTFVAASIDDNKILLSKDKGYRSNLAALDQVERERLLNGNWNIRPAGGLYFQPSWFPVVGVVPQIVNSVRGWDLAATSTLDEKKTAGDFSVGVRVSVDKSGR
ncbi:MAG: terminase family protein, partial [Sneathiella sp.]